MYQDCSLLLTFLSVLGVGFRCFCVFVCQRAAEGSPVLLRAWCDWRAEHPARPHHDAGARLPSGPGHRPLPGAQEWGTTAVNSAPPAVHLQLCTAKTSRWCAECRLMSPFETPEACQHNIILSQHNESVYNSTVFLSSARFVSKS